MYYNNEYSDQNTVTRDSRLSAELAALHIHELLGDAERHRLSAAAARGSRMTLLRALFRFRSRRSPLAAADRPVLDLRIRYAGQGDEVAIAQLAALDSARAPEHPMLLAEVNGQVLAAMSLWDGHVVADPFHHTQALVQLLAVRAGQIQSAAGALRKLREAAPSRNHSSEPGSQRA